MDCKITIAGFSEEYNLATAQGYGEWKEYVIDNYSNATAGILRYTPTYSSEKQVEYATELGLVNDEYMVKSVTCAPGEFDSIIEEWRTALKDAGADKVAAEYDLRQSERDDMWIRPE